MKCLKKLNEEEITCIVGPYLASCILYASPLKLRGSTTQNRLIFQLCFIMLKIKLYVCRILCENFIQIGKKMKKFIVYNLSS